MHFSHTDNTKSLQHFLVQYIILTGNVNFTDHEPLVSLRTIESDLEFKSSLNITMDATVYFVNLTCHTLGAVCGESALIYIGAKASVIFINNSARGTNRETSTSFMTGNGPMIYIGIRAKVVFMYNTGLKYGTAGPGVYMINGKIICWC